MSSSVTSIPEATTPETRPTFPPVQLPGDGVGLGAANNAKTSGGSHPIVSIDQPILTPEQEQEKWLGEGMRSAQEKSGYMRAYMKQYDFLRVIHYASQMLNELRTNMLGPQNYYELYMKIYDYLQVLEMYIDEEHERGRSLEEMYEVVQHTGCIVPRLYLLITIGSVYIKTRERPTIELLRDLIEMCKGVQHPTRGLFLRHYLLTMMKNKLPGTRAEGSAADDPKTDGGTVEDTAELILQNFKEMNWLWIRMEARSYAKRPEHVPRSHRERARNELRVLVGMNIVRLSELEGIDRHVYHNAILPRLLTIITKYKEPIAQQYLLEVIIQVFPDEFHLYTWGDLLTCIAKVTPAVDLEIPLTALMERLGNYAVWVREGVTEANSRKEEKTLNNAFTIFKERILALPVLYGTESERRKASVVSFSIASFTRTMLALAKMTIKILPGAFENVDLVLEAVGAALRNAPPTTSQRKNSSTTRVSVASESKSKDLSSMDEAIKVARNLIVYVMDTIKDVNAILDLEHLAALVESLPFAYKRDIAVSTCTSAVNGKTRYIDSLDRVARLFDIIAPIVKDLPDTPPVADDASADKPEDDMQEEQHLVCRVINMVDNEDPSALLKMYSGIRKQLGQGGPERILHTLGAITSLYMRLALKIHKMVSAGGDVGNVTSEKALRYIYSGDGKGMLEILASEAPMQAFYLYLNCVNAADVCELGDVSYDMCAAAFTVYEEKAGDTKEQMDMLTAMTNTLQSVRCMPAESYDVLTTKVCQYSSKLLLKQDQCTAVALCSNLFWKKGLSDEEYKKILECLQRALKLANNVSAALQVPLFVELLNQFLHYYAAKAPGINIKFINALIDLVREASETAEADGDKDSFAAARLYYRNTAKYIRSRQKDDDRWEEIEV